MVEIGGYPILWHIMKIYGAHGLERFTLCLGYKGWVIKQYFLRLHEMVGDFTLKMNRADPPVFHNDRGHEPWEVTCAETGEETATGARLYQVQQYLGDAQTFCFTYGDAVGNVDIAALLDFHWSQGRLATVTGVHPTSRYGEISVEGGRALEFNEKPTVAEGVVSGGFFVLEREIFDYFTDDPQLFFEHDPLRNLARDGQLSVYTHEGFWHPMDTYRDYLHLNGMWREGNRPWEIWNDG